MPRKYLLSTNYMPDTVLGIKVVAVKKTKREVNK